MSADNRLQEIKRHLEDEGYIEDHDAQWLLERVEELEHHLNPRPAANPPKTGIYAAY